MSEYKNSSDGIQESLGTINDTINTAQNVKKTVDKVKGLSDAAKTAKTAQNVKAAAESAKALANVAKGTASGNPVVAIAVAAVEGIKQLTKNPGLAVAFLFISMLPMLFLLFAIILIMILGFALTNAIGLNRMAQKVDIAIYKDLVCDAFVEEYPNKKEIWPQICLDLENKTLTTMSTSEVDALLNQHQPKDQYYAFVLAIRDIAKDDYDRAVTFLNEYKELFEDVLDEVLPEDKTLEVYKIGGNYYRTRDIDVDALSKEYNSKSEINAIFSGAPTWDTNFNAWRAHHQEIQDGSGGQYFTIEDIAAAYAAFTVSSGDSSPVPHADNGQSVLSYIGDYIDKVQAARGTYYNALTDISNEKVNIIYKVHNVDITEEQHYETVPGSCSAKHFSIGWSYPNYCSTYDESTCKQNQSSCSWSAPYLRESYKTYKVKLTDSTLTVANREVFKLHITLSGFRSDVLAGLVITTNKYFDNKTGQSHLFYQYQMDKIGVNKNKIVNPYPACVAVSFGVDLINGGIITDIASLFSGQNQEAVNAIKKKIYDLAEDKTGLPSDFYGLSASSDEIFFDCMDEGTRKVEKEVKRFFTNAPFYRYEPVYYHDCNHEPSGHETCQHFMDEPDVISYGNHKVSKSTGRVCGAPIAEAYNSVFDAMAAGLGKFVGWTGKILDIGLLKDFSNYINNSWVDQHPLYTYARITSGLGREVDGAGNLKQEDIVNGDNDRNHVPTKVLFPHNSAPYNSYAWEVPAGESQTNEGVLSPDFSSVSTEQEYFTIAEKLQFYKADTMRALEDVEIDKFAEAEHKLEIDNSAHSEDICLTGANCVMYGQSHRISTLVWDRVNLQTAFGRHDWPYHQCVTYARGLFYYIYGDQLIWPSGNGKENASGLISQNPGSFNAFHVNGDVSSNLGVGLSSDKDFIRNVKPGAILSASYRTSNEDNEKYGHVVLINWTGYAYKNQETGEWNFTRNEFEAAQHSSDELTPVIIYSDGNGNGHGGTRNHVIAPADKFMNFFCEHFCEVASPKTTSLFKQGKTGAQSFDDIGTFDFVTGTKGAYDVDTQKCVKNGCKLQAMYDELVPTTE